MSTQSFNSSRQPSIYVNISCSFQKLNKMKFILYSFSSPTQVFLVGSQLSIMSDSEIQALSIWWLCSLGPQVLCVELAARGRVRVEKHTHFLTAVARSDTCYFFSHSIGKQQSYGPNQVERGSGKCCPWPGRDFLVTALSQGRQLATSATLSQTLALFFRCE